MNNREMEAILYRAGEALPRPAKAAPTLPRRSRLPRLAAVLAAVLFCCATVFATSEVPIPDSSEYSQWTGFPCDPADYGLSLENSYGAYVLTEDAEMWIVPRGATYLEALNGATYRALSRSYSNSGGAPIDGWGRFSISAGSTAHPYWRAYYEMDENDIPTNLQDMTAHPYRDLTLYCGEYRSEDSDSSLLFIRWVDDDRGFVYSLCFSGAMADRTAALEFTQMLIDTMN